MLHPECSTSAGQTEVNQQRSPDSPQPQSPVAVDVPEIEVPVPAPLPLSGERVDLEEPTVEVEMTATDNALAVSLCAEAESAVSTPVLVTSCQHDIGLLIRTGMSTEAVAREINALDVGEKHDLIYKHDEPPAVLPAQYSQGCNRKFNISWLAKHSWLRYSTSTDGIFCAPCAIMLSAEQRRGKGYLVNSPFSNWVKISETLSTHVKLRYHQDCVAAADIMHDTVLRPAARIDVITDQTLRERQRQNLHILRTIVRATIYRYLAKQGIALRGDREAESMAAGRNPGNILALVKEFAKDDSILKEHLETPRLRNATYISPRVQNEIIGIISSDIILPHLIAEVRNCPNYAILADEVTSHNTEYMAVCVRFVDATASIREEFVALVKLERVHAVDISNALQDVIRKVGLSLSQLRGQGYDGASTMSGERGGVQKLLMERQPTQGSVYALCRSLLESSDQQIM